MTDNGHTDHEQLARRLHEQGQAQAPADLAGDVMRQVRAEPRQPQRAWLRPVALCAAVVVLLAASIAGLARIGGSGQSSSAGSAAETHAAARCGRRRTSPGSARPTPGADAAGATGGRRPRRQARDPVAAAVLRGSGAHLRAARPGRPLRAVSRQLQAWAAAGPAGATTYNVQIRRAPASARLALTCP